MTVRLRLLLTLGAIIVLMALPAVYGMTQLQRLREMVEALESIHAGDVLALGRLRESLSELDRLKRSYVATPREEFRQGMHSQISLAQSQLGLLSRSEFTDEVARPLALVDNLALATRHLERLVEAERYGEATQYFDAVKPVLDEARIALDPLARALEERGRVTQAEARQVSAAATRTTTLVVVLALLLTGALGLWTTGALSRPLRRLNAATAAVADGDFLSPADLPYDRDDEIGDLSRAFGTMTERLAELDRLKAEFVSLATHELKTPINVIGGYAELLEEGLYGELDQKQRDVLALIQEQTRVLTRLVNQLLDLSRFEAGGVPVELAPVELSALLREVDMAFRALATQKQVTFTVEPDPDLPATAVLDPDRIRHEVLGNLLSNALKFTPTGGEVRVRAWPQDQALHLEVRDTGVGIPPDQIPHIFDKYYQVGSDARSKGAGLGLAIVKHVIEAHGGRIRAESELGDGTCFHVVLPQPPEIPGMA